MAARCAAYWLPVMTKHKTIPTWGSKYEVASVVTQSGSIFEDEEGDEDLEFNDNKSDASELNIDDILDFE